MKNWIEKNYKTLIIAAFLIPILTVAVVSISHVTEWYGISNPISWAVYLSIGIEIAALSALAAISANMGSKVYFPFAIVTIVQFVGNIFFAYSYINIDTKQFKDWVDLVSPFVEFMGVDPNDQVGHKRFLAFFAGGMLPLISLSFLHMLVKFTEEDRKNGEKLVTENNSTQESIKEEQELSNPEDLKQFVDESTRIRLTEEDLKKIEEVLLNPPVPNDKLKQAAENYKETQKDALTEMMKNDQELGLYDEPFDNPMIKESESTFEMTEDEDWGGLTNEELIGDDEIPTPQQEKTQLQKLEEYVNPVQEEIIFQEEPTDEEIQQNFSNIEPETENIFQDDEFISDAINEFNQQSIEDEFEIPEQEGWTEEMEQRYWEEQPIEPFATPEEIERTQIDVQTLNDTLNQVNEDIDNQPQPTQTITVVLDENKLKPFDVDLQVEEPPTEENRPSFEVIAEKKNL
jgi:hypothetical protein